MTKEKDGIKLDVEWFDDPWHPECQHCSYFEHTHCDNQKSDHYEHCIMPTHAACDKFSEKD